MPIERVRLRGRPGYRFGKSGRVYFYKPGNSDSRQRAKALAKRQGKAIEANKKRKR